LPQKPKLIALDGDLSVLRELVAVAGPHFQVTTCRDVIRALGLVQSDRDVRVLVTEHVMHAATGTSVLEQVRAIRPDVRRVMLTSYADLAAIVLGLHSGAIQHLARKPIDPRELLGAIGAPATAMPGAVASRRMTA
jgi:ActR/RegA family two-component response regulator